LDHTRTGDSVRLRCESVKPADNVFCTPAASLNNEDTTGFAKVKFFFFVSLRLCCSISHERNRAKFFIEIL